MGHPLVRFAIRLAALLSLVFGLHLLILWLLDLPLLGSQIVLAYLFNLIIAIIIFAGLFTFRKKLKQQLGFLFMAGSGLKFLLFFVLFYPTYMADHTMSKLEFFAFFIPYALSLVFEILALSKLLNRLS